MKKSSLYFMLTLLSVLCITSCLDGKNRDSGEVVGVIETSMGTTVIKNKNFNLYCPEIDNLISEGKLNLDDHVYLYYIIDYDKPENNSSMLELNQYATVSMVDYFRFEKAEMKYTRTDTTVVLPNEYLMTDPLPNNIGLRYFYDNYMYLTHTLNQPDENLKVNWDLSCNGYTILPTEENGKRYYDLFLRVTTVDQEPPTGESNKITQPHYVSYEIGNYLQRVAEVEKSYLSNYDPTSSVFSLRIYYPLNLENGIYWGYRVWDLGIAGFLPQEN